MSTTHKYLICFDSYCCVVSGVSVEDLQAQRSGLGRIGGSGPGSQQRPGPSPPASRRPGTSLQSILTAAIGQWGRDAQDHPDLGCTQLPLDTGAMLFADQLGKSKVRSEMPDRAYSTGFSGSPLVHNWSRALAPLKSRYKYSAGAGPIPRNSVKSSEESLGQCC